MGFPGYAVLDLETTGFSPRTERIVEVAVVHVSPDGRTGGEWSTLVHPGRATVGATHVHGIRPADVRGAPRFAQVAAALVEQLAGRVLVAHNTGFDVPFLRAELERAGVVLPAAVSQLCTLQESRRHLPHLLKRKLADCCAAAGVRLSGAHSALGDARATAELLGCYLASGAPGAHDALLREAAATPWPVVAPPAHAPALLQRRVVGSRVVGSRVVGPPPGVFAGARRAEPSGRQLPRTAPRTLPRPLRAGDAVVFTGCDPDERALLEQRCRERGLRVTSAVSGRTVLLVTDDVRSGTRKALRALELGTPVADLATAALLVEAASDERALLEQRCRERGLRVTSAVSGRTVLLVTDDVRSGTRKALRALELGTPVADLATAALLVEAASVERAEPLAAPAVVDVREIRETQETQETQETRGVRVSAW